MGNFCGRFEDEIPDRQRTPGILYIPTTYSERQIPDYYQPKLMGVDSKPSAMAMTPDKKPTYGSPAAVVDHKQEKQAQQEGSYENEVISTGEVDTPINWTKGELIGIGAFGRVFSGLNNDTGELMAVKQVGIAKDENLRGRVAEHIIALESEVMVLKNLKHENIVRYLGIERSDEGLNIFLEYVSGGSIASLLAKFGKFQENVIRSYTRQILKGLDYLHQRHIMHRDIKGANILIDKSGVVKLADFGASKKIEDLATIGSAGCKSIKGTPYWMAPEVIKQTGHGRPADIWSVACTVIEMATGKPPWSNYNAPVAAMFHIASSKDPPPIPDHLSPEAQDFLRLCFNRVPTERPNASRLLKHPFITNTLSSAPRTPPVPSSQMQTQALPPLCMVPESQEVKASARSPGPRPSPRRRPPEGIQTTPQRLDAPLSANRPLTPHTPALHQNTLANCRSTDFNPMTEPTWEGNPLPALAVAPHRRRTMYDDDDGYNRRASDLIPARKVTSGESTPKAPLGPLTQGIPTTSGDVEAVDDQPMERGRQDDASHGGPVTEKYLGVRPRLQGLAPSTGYVAQSVKEQQWENEVLAELEQFRQEHRLMRGSQAAQQRRMREA